MRDPDMVGASGRAWMVALTERTREAHQREWGYADSSVASWIVNGPWHPLWSWWMVAVVHLRDVEGAPPSFLYYPGAEFEFMVVSMDPEPSEGRPAVPDVDRFEQTGDAKGTLPGFLMPPDAVVQFDGVTDEQAAEVCRLAVRASVQGGMSLDSDFSGWWETAIPNTVRHVLGMPH